MADDACGMLRGYTRSISKGNDDLKLRIHRQRSRINNPSRSRINNPAPKITFFRCIIDVAYFAPVVSLDTYPSCVPLFPVAWIDNRVHINTLFVRRFIGGWSGSLVIMEGAPQARWLAAPTFGLVLRLTAYWYNAWQPIDELSPPECEPDKDLPTQECI